MTMQSTDPYASPQSDIGDINDTEYGEVKVFSFSGRIGRIRYLAYSMGLMFLVSLIGGLLTAIAAPAMANQGDIMAGGIGLIIMILVYGIIIVASFALAVRRLNDFDTSGWLSLLLLVPIVNAILGIVLWVIPGTKGANRFGPQPPPNGAGVTLLGLLMPILMAIGIIAAVAIPAYHDYAARAAQVQMQ